MSEILKTDGAVDSENGKEWQNMIEDDNNVVKRLEDGEDPETIIKTVYEAGNLTPEFIEEYGSTLMQYGLRDDKLEHYDELARQRGAETLEDKRRRFDEEPEQEGYEADAV